MMTMKVGRCGRGPTGLPAIEWWRHGVAAAGEPSVVSTVQEYPTERARDEAVLSHFEEQGR
jgi:hypothetical protein